MLKRLKRAVKRIHNWLHPVRVEKPTTLCLDMNALQLVIIRRRLPNGTPYNTVWLMGRQDRVLPKFFDPFGNLTSLGIKYAVQLRTFNYSIIIRRHANLRYLCRKCGIRKVIVMHVQLSDLPF